MLLGGRPKDMERFVGVGLYKMARDPRVGSSMEGRRQHMIMASSLYLVFQQETVKMEQKRPAASSPRRT